MGWACKLGGHRVNADGVTEVKGTDIIARTAVCERCSTRYIVAWRLHDHFVNEGF